jgi:putative ABC transport system permease protein
MPATFYKEVPDALAAQDRIERALAALPGVTGVSGTNALPLTQSANQSTIVIPGAPGNTGVAEKDRPLVDWIGIKYGYVEVMGMRVLAGRSFERARRPDVREALIDEYLAKQFFPSGTPLGVKIPFGGEKQFVTIVGVVQQARMYGVHEDGRPQLYVRAEDAGMRNLSYVVRTSRAPESLVTEVRSAIRAIDSRLAIAEVKTMEQVVGDAVRQQRVSAVLIAGFALGALMLATMGLYGVVSGSVTRRRHEFAVRLALGADHGRVLRLVLSEGARLVGLGLLIGAPGIYVAGGLIRGVLVGVSPLDPVTLATVSLGLALVAMGACYVPARRVLRLEPAQSLRQD